MDGYGSDNNWDSASNSSVASSHSSNIEDAEYHEHDLANDEVQAWIDALPEPTVMIPTLRTYAHAGDDPHQDPEGRIRAAAYNMRNDAFRARAMVQTARELLISALVLTETAAAVGKPNRHALDRIAAGSGDDVPYWAIHAPAPASGKVCGKGVSLLLGPQFVRAGKAVTDEHNRVISVEVGLEKAGGDILTVHIIAVYAPPRPSQKALLTSYRNTVNDIKEFIVKALQTKRKSMPTILLGDLNSSADAEIVTERAELATWLNAEMEFHDSWRVLFPKAIEEGATYFGQTASRIDFGFFRGKIVVDRMAVLLDVYAGRDHAPILMDYSVESDVITTTERRTQAKSRNAWEASKWRKIVELCLTNDTADMTAIAAGLCPRPQQREWDCSLRALTRPTTVAEAMAGRQLLDLRFHGLQKQYGMVVDAVLESEAHPRAGRPRRPPDAVLISTLKNLVVLQMGFRCHLSREDYPTPVHELLLRYRQDIKQYLGFLNGKSIAARSWKEFLADMKIKERSTPDVEPPPLPEDHEGVTKAWALRHHLWTSRTIILAKMYNSSKMYEARGARLQKAKKALKANDTRTYHKTLFRKQGGAVGHRTSTYNDATTEMIQLSAIELVNVTWELQEGKVVVVGAADPAMTKFEGYVAQVTDGYAVESCESVSPATWWLPPSKRKIAHSEQEQRRATKEDYKHILTDGWPEYLPESDQAVVRSFMTKYKDPCGRQRARFEIKPCEDPRAQIIHRAIRRMQATTRIPWHMGGAPCGKPDDSEFSKAVPSKWKMPGPSGVKLWVVEILFPQHVMDTWKELAAAAIRTALIGNDMALATTLPLPKGDLADGTRPVTFSEEITKAIDAIPLTRAKVGMDSVSQRRQTTASGFNTMQYGFRSQRSTIDHGAVMRVLHDIARTPGSPPYCSFIFDLLSWFDGVNHQMVDCNLSIRNAPGEFVDLQMELLSRKRVRYVIRSASGDLHLSDVLTLEVGAGQGDKGSPDRGNISMDLALHCYDVVSDDEASSIVRQPHLNCWEGLVLPQRPTVCNTTGSCVTAIPSHNVIHAEGNYVDDFTGAGETQFIRPVLDKFLPLTPLVYLPYTILKKKMKGHHFGEVAPEPLEFPNLDWKNKMLRHVSLAFTKFTSSKVLGFYEGPDNPHLSKMIEGMCREAMNIYSLYLKGDEFREALVSRVFSRTKYGAILATPTWEDRAMLVQGHRTISDVCLHGVGARATCPPHLCYMPKCLGGWQLPFLLSELEQDILSSGMEILNGDDYEGDYHRAVINHLLEIEPNGQQGFELFLWVSVCNFLASRGTYIRFFYCHPTEVAIACFLDCVAIFLRSVDDPEGNPYRAPPPFYLHDTKEAWDAAVLPSSFSPLAFQVRLYARQKFVMNKQLPPSEEIFWDSFDFADFTWFLDSTTMAWLFDAALTKIQSSWKAEARMANRQPPETWYDGAWPRWYEDGKFASDALDFPEDDMELLVAGVKLMSTDGGGQNGNSAGALACFSAGYRNCNVGSTLEVARLFALPRALGCASSTPQQGELISSHYALVYCRHAVGPLVQDSTYVQHMAQLGLSRSAPACSAGHLLTDFPMLLPCPICKRVEERGMTCFDCTSFRPVCYSCIRKQFGFQKKVSKIAVSAKNAPMTNRTVRVASSLRDRLVPPAFWPNMSGWLSGDWTSYVRLPSEVLHPRSHAGALGVFDDAEMSPVVATNCCDKLFEHWALAGIMVEPDVVDRLCKARDFYTGAPAQQEINRELHMRTVDRIRFGAPADCGKWQRQGAPFGSLIPFKVDSHQKPEGEVTTEGDIPDFDIAIPKTHNGTELLFLTKAGATWLNKFQHRCAITDAGDPCIRHFNHKHFLSPEISSLIQSEPPSLRSQLSNILMEHRTLIIHTLFPDPCKGWTSSNETADTLVDNALGQDRNDLPDNLLYPMTCMPVTVSIARQDEVGQPFKEPIRSIVKHLRATGLDLDFATRRHQGLLGNREVRDQILPECWSKKSPLELGTIDGHDLDGEILLTRALMDLHCSWIWQARFSEHRKHLREQCPCNANKRATFRHHFWGRCSLVDSPEDFLDEVEGILSRANLNLELIDATVSNMPACDVDPVRHRLIYRLKWGGPLIEDAERATTCSSADAEYTGNDIHNLFIRCLFPTYMQGVPVNELQTLILRRSFVVTQQLRKQFTSLEATLLPTPSIPVKINIPAPQQVPAVDKCTLLCCRAREALHMEAYDKPVGTKGCRRCIATCSYYNRMVDVRTAVIGNNGPFGTVFQAQLARPNVDIPFGITLAGTQANIPGLITASSYPYIPIGSVIISVVEQTGAPSVVQAKLMGARFAPLDADAVTYEKFCALADHAHGIEITYKKPNSTIRSALWTDIFTEPRTVDDLIKIINRYIPSPLPDAASLPTTLRQLGIPFLSGTYSGSSHTRGDKLRAALARRMQQYLTATVDQSDTNKTKARRSEEWVRPLSVAQATAPCICPAPLLRCPEDVEKLIQGPAPCRRCQGRLPAGGAIPDGPCEICHVDDDNVTCCSYCSAVKHGSCEAFGEFLPSCPPDMWLCPLCYFLYCINFFIIDRMLGSSSWCDRDANAHRARAGLFQVPARASGARDLPDVVLGGDGLAAPVPSVHEILAPLPVADRAARLVVMKDMIGCLIALGITSIHGRTRSVSFLESKLGHYGDAEAVRMLCDVALFHGDGRSWPDIRRLLTMDDAEEEEDDDEDGNDDDDDEMALSPPFPHDDDARQLLITAIGTEPIRWRQVLEGTVTVIDVLCEQGFDVVHPAHIQWQWMSARVPMQLLQDNRRATCIRFLAKFLQNSTLPVGWTEVRQCVYDLQNVLIEPPRPVTGRRGRKRRHD